MIAHVSIPSSRPEEIAVFLAKIIGGEAFPFPSVPGAWITFKSDGSGHAIEVYPLGTVGRPGGHFEIDPKQTMASAHHMAITTKMKKEEVFQLAKGMEFHVVACERGPFEVVEVWIENLLLVEVLTEPELKRYLAIANPEAAKQRFGRAQ